MAAKHMIGLLCGWCGFKFDAAGDDRATRAARYDHHVAVCHEPSWYHDEGLLKERPVVYYDMETGAILSLFEPRYAPPWLAEWRMAWTLS